jgi:FkbM family methyltransferase
MILTSKSQKYGFSFHYLSDDSYIGCQMVHDNCEPVESALFAKTLSPDSVVLDLGANIGYYSLIAATRLNPSVGRVYAFEPQSLNYQLFVRNLELNNITCVTPINAAVGRESGVQRLYLCKRDGVVLNHGDHRLWRMDEHELEEFEEVPVVRLDEMLADVHWAPTIVKMDTQGWEYEILQGMTDFLNKRSPLYLFAEFSPAAYPFVGTDPLAFYQFLVEQFDTIHIVDDLTESGWPVTRYEDIPAYCQLRQHTHANLFCVRGFSGHGKERFHIGR